MEAPPPGPPFLNISESSSSIGNQPGKTLATVIPLLNEMSIQSYEPIVYFRITAEFVNNPNE